MAISDDDADKPAPMEITRRIVTLPRRSSEETWKKLTKYMVSETP